MVNRSKKLLGTPEVGQTVAVPIPMYDRGKGDSKNLLGRIAEVIIRSYLRPFTYHQMLTLLVILSVRPSFNFKFKKIII